MDEHTTEIYFDNEDPQNPGWAYRHTDSDGQQSSGEIDGLDDLLVVLKWGGDVRVWDERGTERDLSQLPEFGGEYPKRTAELWSWDEDRFLVGTCSDDFEIVDRS